MEPGRDDEEPDDDGALITRTLPRELAEIISRAPTHTEWPYHMVRLACDQSGQYRKETLIEKFGGDVLMPYVRHLIVLRRD
jgi:hypothetical protein